MKKSLITLTAAIMAATMSITSWAAEWKQDTTGWWYEQDGGGYTTGWQWIDGKCYYFADNGYMAANTMIDGYTLNADGQWIVDGVIQTQGTEAGYNENGLSNIAIDLLEHTRAENAAKYGEVRVEEMAGEYLVYYSNINFYTKYQYSDLNDKPIYVKSYANQATEIFKDAPMTGNAYDDRDVLKSKGYKTTTNGDYVAVDCGKYTADIKSNKKNVQVYIKFDYQ